MSLTDWMSKRKSYITSTTTNECYVAGVLNDEGTVGKNIDFNYCLVYSIHVFRRRKKWHFLLQKWSSCFLWRKSWFLSIQNLGLWSLFLILFSHFPWFFDWLFNKSLLWKAPRDCYDRWSYNILTCMQYISTRKTIPF